VVLGDLASRQGQRDGKRPRHVGVNASPPQVLIPDLENRVC
jgi:hypothetical protein